MGIPGESCTRGGKGASQRGELVSQEETSQSSNHLSDTVQDETEAQTVLGQCWVGAHLD